MRWGGYHHRHRGTHTHMHTHTHPHTHMHHTPAGTHTPARTHTQAQCSNAQSHEHAPGPVHIQMLKTSKVKRQPDWGRGMDVRAATGARSHGRGRWDATPHGPSSEEADRRQTPRWTMSGAPRGKRPQREALTSGLALEVALPIGHPASHPSNSATTQTTQGPV